MATYLPFKSAFARVECSSSRLVSGKLGRRKDGGGLRGLDWRGFGQTPLKIFHTHD
jgi:hypothetical protein